jgi:hypothetical protein
MRLKESNIISSKRHTNLYSQNLILANFLILIDTLAVAFEMYLHEK